MEEGSALVMNSSTSRSCYIIGEASLLIKCGDILIQNGFNIKGIISNETKICSWAQMNHLNIIDPKSKYVNKLKEAPFDYLFSIVNYQVMKKDILDLPEIMAINFHDAILQRYGGIHATSWALLNDEKTHGITWHVMEEGIDTGDILKQKQVDIDDGETAFSLNLKCYSAAIEAFDELVQELLKGAYERKQQSSEERTYYGKYDKVANGGVITWPTSAETIDRIVRALDFGEQFNRLGSAKLYVKDKFYIINHTRILDTSTNVQPGTIIKLEDHEIIIGTSTYDLALRLSTIKGQEIQMDQFAQINQLKEGEVLENLESHTLAFYENLYKDSSKYETYWANRLLELEGPNLQDILCLNQHKEEDHYIEHTIKFPKKFSKIIQLHNLNDWDGLFLGVCAFLARVGESQEFDIGLISSEVKQIVKNFEHAFSSEIPCRIKLNQEDDFRAFCIYMNDHLSKIRTIKTYSYEIISRFPELYSASKKDVLNKLPIAIEEYQSSNNNMTSDYQMVIAIDALNYKGQVLFNNKVYDPDKTKKLLDRIPIFINEIIKKMDQPIMKTNILSAKEYKKIVMDWNSQIIEYPKDKCTYQLIEEQVKKTPKNIAVIYEDNQITYEELNQKANQLANYLKTKGISEGHLIGVLMERSIDLMIALIGIWKVKCAYVPLDPIYPKDRLQHMIEEASIPLIITQSDLVDRLPDMKSILVQVDVERDAIFNEFMNKIPRNRKEDQLSSKERLAYVIFTSGSTGKPKGVQVTQRNLTNYLWFVVESQGFTEKDKFMALTTICFDISLCELFANLIRGGQVEILPTIMQKDPYMLLEKIEKDWATAIQATPATWDMLVSVGWEKKLPLKIYCGGEAMSPDLAGKLIPRCNELWNIYGPTEATIWSSIKHIKTTDITIGHPIFNTQYYILDKYLNPVPEGTAGELYIGGDGLSLGYLNRQDLTDERFIPNPFDKERSEKIYKTGDFVKFLPDGDVEWLGRIDNQVKLRGFRIELEEIESVLKQQEDIENAVVVLREDHAGFKGLYAFILVSSEQTFDKNVKLSDRLKDVLPSYMIPSHYMILSHFPLTMNKKVDRKSLGHLSMEEIKEKYTVQDEEVTNNQEFVKEAGVHYNQQNISINRSIQYLTKDLIELSASVLKMDQQLFDQVTPLGEYGFDSVSFTVLSIKIKEKYQIKISPAIFYTYTTIEKLADYISNQYYDEIAACYNSDSLASSKYEMNVNMETYESAKNDITISHSNKGSKEPIAVIGIGGILPMSPNLDVFWDNLVNEKDMITEVPTTRWNPFDYYGEDAKAGTGVNPIRAGFIEDVDKFDGGFFNISPREAQLMDPQQRLFIETVWKTIEDAGYKASDLSNQKIGVYVGVVATDYWDLLSQNPLLMDTYTTSGRINCVIANRISYILNLKGPSATIDTACSSSLIAIHRAVTAIQDGYCEGAIAGGVNVMANPFFHVAIGKKGMLSADGKCKTFDKDADGYVRAEGVGAILLKPLSKAETDGDHIYAVIKSSAENHGGRSNAFTVPNAEAQVDLLIEAYEKAEIKPDSITYIEAHGTGTSLGDPIEINAIKDAITKMCDKIGIRPIPKNYLGVGSVKTNIGHLEAGAGVAGLLKVLLSIKHGVLPGSINFNELNPYIDLEDSPLYIVNHTKEWKRLIDENGKVIPRRAGVSSFGFGGSNAHVTLEEYQCTKGKEQLINKDYLIILSGKNENRLKVYAQELCNFIRRNKESDAYNLRDVAYTLQKGREEMEARLAIICHSFTDLESSLSKYINGETDEYVFNNYIKGSKKRNTLLDGEEGETFLKSVVKNNKLPKIAELWLMGIEINWDLFYLDGKCKRVSLPTYPFEKVSHWIPDTKIAWGNNSSNDGLHPFIDKNVSTFEEQIYVKTLNRNEVSIKDHIANGKTVFPGAAYLEMARAAAQLAYKNGKVVKLQNNVWSKALILEDKPIELSITLTPQEQRVSYKIMSGEDTTKQLHSQGIITYGEIEKGDNRLNLNDIKGHLLKSLTKEDCYQMFKEAGFEYGTSYQGIQSLHYNQEEAFTEIELPLECKKQAENYILHPALLDAALQSIIVFIGNSYKASGIIFMPFAMGELEIIKPLTEKCFAYARLTDDKQEGSYHIKKFAIDVTDYEGNVLVSIRDFSLRGLKTAPTVKKHPEAIVSMHYMKEKWVHMPLQKTNINSFNGNLLLFSDDETLFSKLRKNHTFSQVVLIKSGDTYKNVGDDVFEINITNPEDYSQVFRVLEKNAFIPDHIIYYYLNQEIDTNKEGIVSQLNTSIYSMLCLSQGLIKLKAGIKSKILYLCHTDDSVGCPIHSAIKGYLKGFEVENSKAICKVIEIDTYSSHIVDEICIKELEEPVPWIAKSIKYVENSRSISQLISVDVDSRNDIRLLPFKQEGVYIITGGVGKLGMIFAEYLAKNYKARLVLVGRYPLDEERTKRIKMLEALGSEVVYLNGDISKEKDVESLIKGTRNRFQMINGIIHCAGITKDAYIINKDKASIDAVIAAKIYGTIWLDKFSADDQLDLFVMFSSVSAIMGNTGQSDYAYANRFMDHFSKYRSQLTKEGKRNGHTLAIGWPYWTDGGMQLDEATKRFLINTLGIHPMDTEEGIKAFEAALSLKENYILVLKGLIEKLNTVLEIKKPLKTEALTIIEAEPETRMPEFEDEVAVSRSNEKINEKYELDHLLEKVMNCLRRFTSEIQKLDLMDIDSEADISEFGFDSITFTEFSNKINDYYHIGIMPSIFFEHGNLMSLGEYLVKEYIDQIAIVHRLGMKTEQKEMSQMAKDNIAYKAISKSDDAPKFKFDINQSKLNIKWDDRQLLESKSEGHSIEYAKTSNNDMKEPVAIIGVSGIMPQSSDLNEFWKNLEAGKDLITEIPKERWDWQTLYGDPVYEDNKTNVKWGGFMAEVDKFDPLFFGISPKEAALMDPQQRILLENVWKAMEDSGIKPSKLSGSKTGVFIGAGAWDYLYELKENNVDIQAQTSSGVSFSILANRISYLLNLHGPSETIDTACSSSLVALHRAVEQVQKGACELAFAGGINVMLNPAIFISLSKAGMLSEDGRCKTFDKSANGYVRGEGCGVVLLKPLSQAIKDNNQIYAVIKGSAVNHGGHTNSLTTPNPIAQAETIVKAWTDAKVDPSTITYIETHGTGTSLGDPIEINGLKKAFSELYEAWNLGKWDKPYCGLGTVKTNIGHLEWGAGIAGVIKVILAMKHKMLPATLHFKEQNPYINIEESPFYIVDKLEEWQALKDENNQSIPRRAGVSSFGFGGVNAHIALEEYARFDNDNTQKANKEELLILSAKNEGKLKVYAEEMIRFINNNSMVIDAFNIKRDAIANELKMVILKLAAEIIQVDYSEIDHTENLLEYGFDLLHIEKLTESIQDKFNLIIKSSVIANCETIDNIARYLSEHYFNVLAPKLSNLTIPTKTVQCQLDLSQIANTLRFGRDEMEARLAIVARSVDDFKSKLSRYISGDVDQTTIYGNIRWSREKLEKFLEGKVEEEFANDAFRNSQLLDIGYLWVLGGKVEWSNLFNQNHYIPMSLPTYPFERERYWANEKSNQALSNNFTYKRLHPLIDQNISNIYEQKYTSVLNKHAFYIKDHVIDGKMILPGVAYLEMARVAGALSVGEQVFSITDVFWAQPINVEQERDIQIYIQPKETNVDFEILTINADGTKNIHSGGKLIFTQLTPSHDRSSINVDKIKEKCDAVVSKESCYGSFEQKGFNYGESFQTVDEIYSCDYEALAKLSLPEEIENSFEEFILHPSIMDGALHAISGIKKTNISNQLLVPFSIGELEILGTLKKEVYAYAKLAESTDKAAQIKKYHITITDLSGKVMIQINDLILKEMIKKETHHPVQYFNHTWINKELLSTDYHTLENKNIVIFDIDEVLFNEFNHQLHHKGNLYLIKPGEAYRQIGVGMYEIDPSNLSDYIHLVSDFKQTSKMPEVIIHNWSKKMPFNEIEMTDLNVSKILQNSGLSIFLLCKALMGIKELNKTKIFYLYEEDKDFKQPIFGGVSGLANTINNENPNLEITSLGISSEKISCLMIMKELTSKGTDVVYYKQGQRFVKGYDRFIDSVKHIKTTVVEKGVYLITGGAGGLGLLFAEHFARQAKIKLILTGRSELNSSKKLKLKEIEKLGSEVIYIKADISDKESTLQMIQSIKETYGEIKGVIHAAGIIKDDFIIHKSIDEVNQVLQPKLYGCMWVDEATKDEPLDFFIMFSSVACIIGNAGQSDYAYGNAFLDEYVSYREQLRKNYLRMGITISINWPLWEDGGMKMNEKAIKSLEEVYGLQPITAQDGLSAFDFCLQNQITNVLVVKGDKRKLSQLLINHYENQSQSELNEERVRKSDIGNDQVAEELLNIISKEINLPVNKIDVYEPFEKYGVDSIAIIGLNKALEKRFGKISKTLFFEYKNLKELTAYFIAHHKDKFVEKTNSMDTNNQLNAIEKTHIHRFSDKYSQSSDYEAIYQDDIAIIGISGRYPMADDLDTFWENLRNGKDCITEIPKERWDHDIYFDADKNAKGKTYSKWGGFINDMDKFDPMFFGISPKEAEFMDPQERLYLQTVWHTMEDAGYTRTALVEETVGVFAGVMYNQYPMFAAEEQYKGHLVAVNSTYAAVANRVSYYLDLKGPSMVVDTMCSSSLTAIHLACESIKRGDCTLAIAGGVNVSIHPNKYILLSQGKFLTSDGRCRSFGDGGDGYVPGEGVGAVFLKPLKKAIKDGDRIYSVIKGSFLNHGGKTNGYSVPSPKAQGKLIFDAIKRSKINPRTISYLEAHGTGTALGDPIEMTGLLKAFGEFTKDKQFCSIGSVKSNIGHLESAAGVAGLSKVLLQMKHKQLVPSIHSDVVNSNIDFKDSPFYIQHQIKEWTAPIVEGKTYPRRAGISSFGAGGSNAHLILEEHIEVNEVGNNDGIDNPDSLEQLILLSARDNEGLERHINNLINFLAQGNNEIRLRDIAYTLLVGRENMEARLAFIASSIEEAIYLLKESLKNTYDNKKIIRGVCKKSKGIDEIRYLVNSKELFMSGRLMDLASAWIAGDEINWKELYKGKKRKIVSIPGYPFAKEHYWIEQKEENLKLLSHENKLHPLIEKNTSTLKEQKFTTSFNGEESYFKDHIVNGNKMLPGAFYIEMARAAGDLSNDHKVMTIKDVVWSKPIILGDGQKAINISLYPEEEYVEYTIRDDGKGIESDIYSKGKLLYGERKIHANINMNELEKKFNKTLSVNECYKAFSEMGIEYGNRFKVIETLMLGRKDCLARLKLSNEAMDEAHYDILNPYILDGCFQAAIGVDYENKNKGVVYLPYAIEEIKIFDSTKDEVYIYIEQADSEDDLTRKYNMTILDIQGTVLVKIINFTARAVKSSKGNKAHKVNTDKVMELLNQLYEGEVEVSEIKDMLGVLINE